MEIHAPEKPILTIKEAAVHLLIVTVGILIALSLEGLVEYAHHRTVVREARQVMRQEIASNQKELEAALAHMKQQEGDLGYGVDLMTSMARGTKPDKIDIRLNYESPALHAAGHATAELTGAFAYMDYREVSRYAAVYDAQADFLRAEAAAFAEGTATFALGQHRDFRSGSAAEYAAMADRLRQSLGLIIVAGQRGRALNAEYTKILAEP